MTPYRILVVDDSAFMRKLVSDMIKSDERFTVIGTASNGREAVDAVKRLRPDALTMDVEMPVMSGLEALSIIMQEVPTPTVMLSSATFDGADAAIRSLELGAFDFVAKPSGPISMDVYNVKESLISTLMAAVERSNAKVANRLAMLPVERSGIVPAAKPPPVKKVKRLVAIGTSTGGPRALQQVLTQLPGNFPAPVLIVQHMPPGFTRSLAARLDSLCEIQVTEAAEGMALKPGVAYIAPGGYHMTLRKVAGAYKLHLSNEEPPVHGHRPSVDVLFQSLADFPELDRTVALLTGMGSDGAKGMKLLYDQGVRRTIAESESSCIVYGMPRSAVELGCVRSCIPLQEIAEQIMRDVAENGEV